MGGGSAGTNTVQKSDPWSGQQPFLANQYNAAQDYLNSGGAYYYPGKTVADQSQATQSAIGQMANYGNSQPYQTGQAAAGQGLAQLQATAGGAYLNGDQNPQFQNMVNQNIAAARPSVDSAFASTGRLGSGAHAAAFSDAALRQANSLGYQNYNTERQNQLNAAGNLGQQGANYAQLGLVPTQLMGQAGAAQDAYQQTQINADKAAYDYNQNRPLTAAQNYSALIAGNYGGTTTNNATGNAGLQYGGLGVSGVGALGQAGAFKGLNGSMGNLFSSSAMPYAANAPVGYADQGFQAGDYPSF